MTQPAKNTRFQLFLHELHEPTCASAKANGNTLSTEVRQRVKRSFEQDAKLAELRAWLHEEYDNETQSLDRVNALRDVMAILNK